MISYLYDIKIIEKIMCVERHQRTKVDLLDKDTPACEWGQKRGKATKCGECPFGVIIAEPTAKDYRNEDIKDISEHEEAHLTSKEDKRHESIGIMFA